MKNQSSVLFIQSNRVTVVAASYGGLVKSKDRKLIFCPAFDVFRVTTRSVIVKNWRQSVKFLWCICQMYLVDIWSKPSCTAKEPKFSFSKINITAFTYG